MGNNYNTQDNKFHKDRRPPKQDSNFPFGDKLGWLMSCCPLQASEDDLKKLVKQDPSLPNVLFLLDDVSYWWMASTITQVKFDPGKYYVISHGDTDALHWGGAGGCFQKKASPATVAKVIKPYVDSYVNDPDNLPNFPDNDISKVPIVFSGCDTGSCQDGFAAQVSDSMGGRRTMGGNNYVEPIAGGGLLSRYKYSDPLHSGAEDQFNHFSLSVTNRPEQSRTNSLGHMEDGWTLFPEGVFFRGAELPSMERIGEQLLRSSSEGPSNLQTSVRPEA